MLVVYDPTKGEGEERKRFWNDLERIVDRVGNGYSGIAYVCWEI